LAARCLSMCRLPPFVSSRPFSLLLLVPPVSVLLSAVCPRLSPLCRQSFAASRLSLSLSNPPLPCPNLFLPLPLCDALSFPPITLIPVPIVLPSLPFRTRWSFRIAISHLPTAV
jgi:hypothetical protein